MVTAGRLLGYPRLHPAALAGRAPPAAMACEESELLVSGSIDSIGPRSTGNREADPLLRNGCLHASFLGVTMVTEECEYAWQDSHKSERIPETYMRTERDQLSSGYPDPSFALDRVTECADDSAPSTSDCPNSHLALAWVLERLNPYPYPSEPAFDYPDPSLGLLPVEEEEMEEAVA